MHSGGSQSQPLRQLDRFLDRGSEGASWEDALVLRRARACGLIGMGVGLFAGLLPALALDLRGVAAGCVGLCSLLGVMVLVASLGSGRLIRPVLHATLGLILLFVVAAAIRIGGANSISMAFPLLIILVATHVLGAGAGIGWTLASIAGMGASVYGSDPAAHLGGPVPLSLDVVFSFRALIFVAACWLAVNARITTDRQSAELAYLARHDPLTGLYNRRGLEERITQARARAERYGRRFAVLFVDLDGFKAVNDAHGHTVGDGLLREVAARIGSITRRTDAVGRLGGDEFVVLMDDLDEAKFARLHAERLGGLLSRPMDLGEGPQGLRVAVGASIGVACYPEDGVGAHELVLAADRAMYRDKRARLPGMDGADGA